eukprot:Sspe_Gene.91273::Locus_62731_Transcript_1_1_Confidence_1.000_Length_1200::g.91273::m.91273
MDREPSHPPLETVCPICSKNSWWHLRGGRKTGAVLKCTCGKHKLKKVRITKDVVCKTSGCGGTCGLFHIKAPQKRADDQKRGDVQEPRAMHPRNLPGPSAHPPHLILKGDKGGSTSAPRPWPGKGGKYGNRRERSGKGGLGHRGPPTQHRDSWSGHQPAVGVDSGPQQTCPPLQWAPPQQPAPQQPAPQQPAHQQPAPQQPAHQQPAPHSPSPQGAAGLQPPTFQHQVLISAPSVHHHPAASYPTPFWGPSPHVPQFFSQSTQPQAGPSVSYPSPPSSWTIGPAPQVTHHQHVVPPHTYPAPQPMPQFGQPTSFYSPPHSPPQSSHAYRGQRHS